MEKAFKCPECNVDCVLESENIKVLIKDVEIEYTNISYYCEICGDWYDTVKTFDRNVNVVKEKYRNMTGEYIEFGAEKLIKR